MNGPFRWLSSRLVDQCHLLRLLRRPQQQQQLISAGATLGTCSLLLQYRLLQHLFQLSIRHSKGANRTPVIAWQGFPCYRSTPHSRSNNDTHESEHRCNFQPEDVACLGQLHEVVTGGSVRTEPGKNVNPPGVAETARSVLCTPTTRHQDFDQTFAQGPRSGVEAGSRREQQISTGEESERRCARRGILPYPKNYNNCSSTTLLFLLLPGMYYLVCTDCCSTRFSDREIISSQ